MGAYGVSVEKQFTFRGQPELVSNIYHYRITSPVPSDYQSLADAVVARDKAIHPATYAYKTVRVFGPTEGTAAENQMRLVQDLTGNGTGSYLGANIYPELTAVVAIFVGRSPVHNRKVFVRKFIHCLMYPNTTGTQTGEGALTATEQSFFTNWMNGNKSVTANAVSFDMVTPNNVLVPAGNSAYCLPRLRIRQLHQ